MAFRDALNRVFGPHHEENAEGSAFDRARWRKKLALFFYRLPDSQNQWDDLMSEARSLGLDPAWVQKSLREEFSLMIRRAVADGVLTAIDHRKLDLARDLIGITDAEAEATLHTIVADAEAFFGKAIEGK